MSIVYLLVEYHEPKPRATPSYRHSRIVLVNQYVNAYSWDLRARRLKLVEIIISKIYC